MNDTDRNSYRILLTAVKIRLNVTNNFIYYFVRNMELLYLCSEIFDLMKKGRYISIQTIEENSTSYAIFKARSDMDKVIASCGYTPIVLGSRSRIGLFRVLKRYYDIFSLRLKIKRRDVVFFQFPWIHSNKDAFYNNLFRTGARIQCVIHDIDSLRSDDNAKKLTELNALKNCELIIAHTPAMKHYLAEHGINEERIRQLNIFCYLTTDPIHHIDNLSDAAVIFAGNIRKSPFVNHLQRIAGPRLRFNVYGNGAEEFKESDGVEYKGCFSPEHPGVIEGNWGLVWDGGRLDTCDGMYGKYLRYNSSHKAALYLSLGIPVILWSQSALKDYVLDNNLGIVVDSLEELANTLENLPEEKKQSILKSVKDFADVLRNVDTIRPIVISNIQTI